MRQVLLGLLGVLAAGAACAQSYSFTTMKGDSWAEQTIINCTGPSKTNGGERVPQGCTLRERAIAYPNPDHQLGSQPSGARHTTGVACAAGHPVEFYPNGTLAACTLDAEQPVPMPSFTVPVSLGTCKGPVRFDKDGRVEC